MHLSCKMEADQKKKRLNPYSIVSCNSQEEFSAKKKKNVESSQNLLNMRAHISVEWDDNQKRVVAQREQIGITWRDLGPFINSFSDSRKGLADVLSIPQEIFELGDVSGVLSYEVWESHLSETERNVLTQFLPEGTDAEQMVQQLLMGENFHFGNPFVKWGASLCSGNLHPDAVLHQEHCFKASKKAYYLELQEYQNDIVENLHKLKDRWPICEDPEKDIVEKMWSSRKNVGNSLSLQTNESRPCDPQGNLAATSDFCSLVAEENLCNSSKKRTSIKGSGVLQDRRREFAVRRRNSSAVSSLKEDSHKLYIRSGDSAKYMSDFKITRRQLQHVKRIKESGDGIKSKSLNRILSETKRFNVHPYKILEEEHKKLHEQWLQLANRDLPSAFLNWTKRQFQRQQWRRSLGQEMAENKKAMVDEDEEKGNPDSSLEDQSNSGVAHHEAAMVIQTSEDEEQSVHHSVNIKPFQRIPSLNGLHELDPIDRELEEGSPDFFKSDGASPILSKFLDNMNPIEGDMELEIPVHSAKEFVPYSTNIQLLQRIPSLNGRHELNPMDVELEDSSQYILKPEGAAPMLPKFVGSMNPTQDDFEREGLVPSAKDAWLGVGLPNSYYHPRSEIHGYTSAGELSLRQPHPIKEQRTRLVDLETDILDHNAEEALLNRPSNNLGSAFYIDSGGSFFSPYTNLDRDEFLQPFLKEHGTLPSQAHRHKQLGSQFLSTSDGLRSGHHHTGHFQEQLQQLLEQRPQVGERDFFMHQVTHKNLYCSSGRVPAPLQAPVGMQNWSGNPVRVPAPLQAHSNNKDLLGQDRFPAQHQACGGSSEVDASGILGQCLGNRSNADESLYSILSQFNKLQSRSSCNSMRSAEQDVPARNFFGEGIPDNSGVFPHTAHQLNYLSGREGDAAAALKANNIPWMNLPHQNSGLNDTFWKPFLRSSNQ